MNSTKITIEEIYTVGLLEREHRITTIHDQSPPIITVEEWIEAFQHLLEAKGFGSRPIDHYYGMGEEDEKEEQDVAEDC